MVFQEPLVRVYIPSLVEFFQEILNLFLVFKWGCRVNEEKENDFKKFFNEKPMGFEGWPYRIEWKMKLEKGVVEKWGKM